MRLISINIAAYVVLIALSALDQETGRSVSKLLGVEGLKTLGAAWRTIGLIDRPLHLATHMFVHLDVRDLLGNAFILFLVGRIYQNEAGERRLLSTYIAGAIAGFAVYMLLAEGFEYIRKKNIVIGASAAVFAILGAASARKPTPKIHIPLLGPRTLKLVFWLCIIADFEYFSRQYNGGLKILVHWGAALFGVLLARQENKGRNLIGWLEWPLKAFVKDQSKEE